MLSINVRPWTFVPVIDAVWTPVSETLLVLVSDTGPTVPPVTIRPPAVPVVFRSTVSAVTFWTCRPNVPIVVLRTSRVGPESALVRPVAVTVPPPVAEKDGMVSRFVRLTVAPVLLRSSTPAPLSDTGPVKATVPPDRLRTDTELPAVAAMAEPIVMAPAPPSSATPLTVDDATVAVLTPLP